MISVCTLRWQDIDKINILKHLKIQKTAELKFVSVTQKNSTE